MSYKFNPFSGDFDYYAESLPYTAITGLTANQILFGSAGGGISQSANLTFDGTTLNATTLTESSVRLRRKNSKERIVDAAGNGDYSTIAAAIAVSSSGDLIRVMPGTYSESNLILPSGVDLIGSGRDVTIISANYNGAILVLSGDNDVSGLSLENSGTGVSSSVISTGGADAYVHDVKVTGSVDTVNISHDILLESVEWGDFPYDGIILHGGTSILKNCVVNSSPTDIGLTAFVNHTSGTLTIMNCSINLSRSANEGVMAITRTSAGTGTIYSIGNKFVVNAGTQEAYGFSSGLGTPTIYSSNDYFTLTGSATYHVYASFNLGTFNIIGGNLISISGTPTINYIQSSPMSIPSLRNLTSNGFVVTSGGIGTLSVDTSTYYKSGDSPSFAGVTATSFVIGANTITTAEWANLDGLNQTLATTSSPSFTGLTVSGGTITGANSESIQIGVSDDIISFVGAGGTNNQTIRFNLDNSTGPIIDVSTENTVWIQFQDGIFVNNTIDTFGRLILAQKTNYNLNTATQSQYPMSLDARFSTAGAQQMYAQNLNAEADATSGTQSANFGGLLANTKIDGDVTISAAVIGSDWLLTFNSASSINLAFGVRSRALISNTKTSAITTYYGFLASGIDGEDGTVITAYDYYASAHQKDTGTFTNAIGMWLEKQTVGGTLNASIVLDGDGIGSNIIFGDGQDVTQYYSGTAWVFDILQATTEIVFNESSFDTDFRIEGNNDVNLFFCDAGNDRVGIGMNNPGYKLDVTGDVNCSGAYRSGGTTGVTGSFTTVDSKTVTVTKGIITAIV